MAYSGRTNRHSQGLFKVKNGCRDHTACDKNFTSGKNARGGGGGYVKSLRPYVVYPFRIRLSIKVALESGFVVVVNC